MGGFKQQRELNIEHQAQPVVVVSPTPGVGNSAMDIRGLLADRPDAALVPIGSTFTAADRIGETDFVSMTNGTVWVDL
jgi:hypothetical protein